MRERKEGYNRKKKKVVKIIYVPPETSDDKIQP